MTSTSRASSSIIAAGIFAILGGVLGALFNLAALILFSFSKFPPGAIYPDFMRPVLYVIWTFGLFCAVFLVVVGIQVIRLKNWARIALLIVAGCLLFFGVIGFAVIIVTIFGATPTAPLVSKAVLASVLAVTYGIPVVIALWWLILLTRTSVVTQFHSPAALESQSPVISTFRLSKPGCPLAVRIIGWYLASFVLFVPFLPFFPKRIPAFFFGHFFRGPAALIFLFLYFALLIIPGFGLLLLKRWSYPLTIASQLLVCANGLAATFSPTYTEMVRSVLAGMNLPELAPTAEQMVNYSRTFNLLSLTIPIAILITLLVVHRQFFAAADNALSDGTVAIPR
ncbi:MAG TPA: hypothetical protein VF863_01800 [Candidatus Acidoferrum sp.]